MSREIVFPTPTSVPYFFIKELSSKDSNLDKVCIQVLAELLLISLAVKVRTHSSNNGYNDVQVDQIPRSR
jgi:hypothetical protein